MSWTPTEIFVRSCVCQFAFISLQKDQDPVSTHQEVITGFDSGLKAPNLLQDVFPDENMDS